MSRAATILRETADHFEKVSKVLDELAFIVEANEERTGEISNNLDTFLCNLATVLPTIETDAINSNDS